MGTINMTPSICLRKDTEDAWLSVNPILRKGEIAIVEFNDHNKIKIGDGVRHFRDLDYYEDPRIKSLQGQINHLKMDLCIFASVVYFLITVLAIYVA